MEDEFGSLPHCLKGVAALERFPPPQWDSGRLKRALEGHCVSDHRGLMALGSLFFLLLFSKVLQGGKELCLALLNCLASPGVHSKFVSKMKNKVTWTSSWLFAPASLPSVPGNQEPAELLTVEMNPFRFQTRYKKCLIMKMGIFWLNYSCDVSPNTRSVLISCLFRLYCLLFMSVYNVRCPPPTYLMLSFCLFLNAALVLFLSRGVHLSFLGCGTLAYLSQDFIRCNG